MTSFGDICDVRDDIITRAVGISTCDISQIIWLTPRTERASNVTSRRQQLHWVLTWEDANNLLLIITTQRQGYPTGWSVSGLVGSLHYRYCHAPDSFLTVLKFFHAPGFHVILWYLIHLISKRHVSKYDVALILKNTYQHVIFDWLRLFTKFCQKYHIFHGFHNQCVWHPNAREIGTKVNINGKLIASVYITRGVIWYDHILHY